MSALLGGFTITSAAWVGPQSLSVGFTSIYTDCFHQLYFGRSLVGCSKSFASRAVIGNVIPSKWPEEIQLVAVTADDRDTDFGSALPPRPYNRVKLDWVTSGFAAAGATKVQVTAGDVAGGAVDPNNLLENVLFTADGPFEFITDPLPGSGTWNFSIAGRDGTKPSGNLGSALTAAASIDAHPPDVLLLDPQGDRLTAGVASGNLNLSWTYDW